MFCLTITPNESSPHSIDVDTDRIALQFLQLSDGQGRLPYVLAVIWQVPSFEPILPDTAQFNETRSTREAVNLAPVDHLARTSYDGLPEYRPGHMNILTPLRA